jgi:hypothetical protein
VRKGEYPVACSVSLALPQFGKAAYIQGTDQNPEPRLPFDTPAATDSNSGPYLECKRPFQIGEEQLHTDVAETIKSASMDCSGWEVS